MRSTFEESTAWNARGVRGHLAIIAMVAIAVAMAGPALAGDPHGFVSTMSGSAPSESNHHGIYRFDDGTELTLFGSHSSSQYEFAGLQVNLVADGEDRFVARDDPTEVLMVVRDGDGIPVGVLLDRVGQPTRRGQRLDVIHEQPVRFTSGEVDLSGTLLTPIGEGPFPAVVIVHGAEFGTREVYRLLASHFARRGVAALMYDRRGTGESTGSFTRATFDDLARDALAAVGAVVEHPGVDRDRVGLLGFSQGGWVIALAAQQSDDVDFLIPVSASGLPAANQAAWLSGNLLHLRGLDAGSVETARRGWGMLYSTLPLVDAGVMPAIPDVPGFWFHALDPHLDPYDLWSEITQPVLGVWGGFDCQVPAVESAAILGRALGDGGNQDVTLRVLPAASHSMLLVEPCAHELGGMHGHGGRFGYPDEYFGLLAGWVTSRADVETAGPVGAPDESPLGWFMGPDMNVRWYGTFVPQAIGYLVMLGIFGRVLVARGWALTFGRSGSVAARRSAVWRLSGLFSLAALTTLFIGLGALAELLQLGDVHTDFIVGGPVVAGVSPLTRMASVAAWIAVAAGAGYAYSVVRARRGGDTGDGPAVPLWQVGGTLMLIATFVGMAGYWGLLWPR